MTLGALELILKKYTEGDAEVAKRKKRRKLKGGAAKFLIVLLLLSAIVITAFCLPLFNITNIAVEGNSALKAEEIIKVSQIGRGYNLFRTSSGKAKKNILAMPCVKDVKIKKILPSGIKIIVTEEKAAAYVIKGDSFVSINAGGKVLEITKKPRKGIMKMPNMKISESVAGEIIKYKNANSLEIQKSCMEKLEQNGLLSKAVMLDISNASDIKIEFDNGLLAQIGDMEELDYKIKMIETVLKQGYSSGIFNIENTAQPTYRKNE